MNTQPLVIKRYQNRKMYDTEKSCYIQLDDISSLLKSGRDIKVIDQKTNTDITTVTMMSVIHQNELAAKSKPLDLAFMQRLVSMDSMSTYAQHLQGRLQ